MSGYDALITKVPKATSPTQTIVSKAGSPSQTIVAKATAPTDTKVPKPYPEEPNILWTEAGIGILTESGQGLLMQVG